MFTIYRYLIVYDIVSMFLITMFLFMIWATDASAKATIILFLAIKVLWGLAFMKAEDTKWIKFYFYLRVAYDILIITPIVLIMVATTFLNLINATLALFLLLGSEGILIWLIYKYLTLRTIQTFVPELLEIEEHKKKIKSYFHNLAHLDGSEQDV
jgi:hypothetical protein